MIILRFLALFAMVCGHVEQGDSRINRLQEANAAQVLIIGGGISGLEAARLLQQNGIKTLVLEARNRTGGRIWSMRSKAGYILDMGASFIHGIHGSIPSGLLTNPIWDIAQEAHIRTGSRKQRDSLGFYPVNGSITDARRWYGEYKAFVREETRISSTNVSLEYYVNLFAKQKNFTEQQQYTFSNYVYFAIGVVEGAELSAIGAKGYLDVTSVHYGEDHIFHETGFMAITDYLARDLDGIRLQQVVTKINYTEEFVQVSTRNGQVYRSEFVLITVPLGVLKSKQIEFNPPLPQWKLGAIDRIGFGTYEKVFLLWDQAWWNLTDFYFYRTQSNSTDFRYFIGAHKWNGKSVIECIFASDAVRWLKSKLNTSEIVEEIRSTLQKMFPNIVIPPPVEIYITNWNQDSFSHGSYSYISINQKYEDPLYLSEPVNNRLLFAGEATSTDTYGYTYGALLSARREVNRLRFVYNVLPKPNSTHSRSTIIIPPKTWMIISIAYCLFFFFY